MSKIEIETYREVGFSCKSDDCPYRQECAQHDSAGDFRDEDGFTPELFMTDSGVNCETKDKKPANVVYGSYPENYNDLSSGSLSLPQLKLTLPVLFSQLLPGDRFRYAGEVYTKVNAHHLSVSDGIKAVLKEKNLFVSKRGNLLTMNPDFLVVKV